MSISQNFAQYAANFQFDDLQPSTVTKATDLLLNGFGIAVAGSVERQSQIAARHATGTGFGGGATLLAGESRTASLPLAAFANGVSSHANDADDTDVRTHCHPTAGILGALMSVAEYTHASGQEFIAAYVLALEFMDRLGIAAPVSEHISLRGYHAVGPLCHMGATLGAAKLFGLSSQQIEHALGLATATSSGVQLSVGSMAKSYHAGIASQSGVLNALMARDGFTSVSNWLQHRHGWLKVFGGVNSDPALLLKDFGNPWTIDSPGFTIKATPGQGALGPALEWLTRKRQDLNLTAKDIDSVRIGMSDFLLIWGNMWTGTPSDTAEAKYNGQYRMALALVHGTAGVRDYTEERLTDREVLDLAKRIQYYQHPDSKDYENPFGILPFSSYSDPSWRRCHMTLKLASGETISEWARTCKGNPADPFTREELELRFRECVDGILPEAQIEESLYSLTRLSGVKDMSAVIRGLCGSRATSGESHKTPAPATAI